MLRKSADLSSNQEPVEKQDAATESSVEGVQPVDMFALLGGMMGTMQEVAKEAESEKFKNDMEKDPIGSAFALMFRMMGGMVEGMEKAVNNAENKPADEPIKDAKVPSTPSSPSVAKMGMYASPISSPEVERSVDSATATPVFPRK